MRGTCEKGVTTCMRTQAIKGDAALHQLCDNLFCASSRQTLSSHSTAITQPNN